ncbi:MAG: Hsp20/alpha crystallin family protein [Nanoarchaeota archaeon]
MGLFDDDFDEIVREFFGGVPSRRISQRKVISGEDEERNIDFVETNKNYFVVFELPGYSKEDIDVQIKGHEILITAHKKVSEKVEKYMANRLNQGIKIIKTLPKQIKTKKFEYNFKNGVLEIKFRK